MRVAWGITIGFCILFVLFWGYRKVITPFYTLTVPKFVTDTSKKYMSQEALNDLKTSELTLTEKVESENKRLDDILIFGGVIVTLLLAINIGVYVNAKKEVANYMEDNFSIHKKKIDDILAEVQESAGKAKTELELFQAFTKDQTRKIQTPIG